MALNYKMILDGIGHKISTYRSASAKHKEIGLSWFKIKKLKHTSGQDIRTYQLFGAPVSYSNGSDLLHSLEEIFIDEIYKIKLPDNAVIVDCGANIGLSAIYFHKIAGNARITAYEPDAISFKLLKDNLAAAGVEATLHQEAVWISNGHVEFINDGGLGSKIGSSEGNVTKVKSTRLYDVINHKIDLLKMDIEGAEYHVIKDIEDKMSLIDNLFIEYHGTFDNQRELLEILQIVQRQGFSFYIKEALNVYHTPFYRNKKGNAYDVQLNIFCFRS